MIAFITNRMLPKMPLPNPALAFAYAHCRQALGSWQRARKCVLDRFPACRIISITRRQGPAAMGMIGQHHPGINVKRALRAYLSYCFAKDDDMLDQQAAATIKQVSCEEIGSAWDAIAAIVWHWKSVPDWVVLRYGFRRNLCGGRRFAFPPYVFSPVFPSVFNRCGWLKAVSRLCRTKPHSPMQALADHVFQRGNVGITVNITSASTAYANALVESALATNSRMSGDSSLPKRRPMSS